MSASFYCQCTLASRVTVRCICVEGSVRSPRAKTFRIHCANGCLLVTRSAACAFVCSSTKFASCVVVVSFLCALPRWCWSEVSVRPARMLGGVPPTLWCGVASRLCEKSVFCWSASWCPFSVGCVVGTRYLARTMRVSWLNQFTSHRDVSETIRCILTRMDFSLSPRISHRKKQTGMREQLLSYMSSNF